MSTQSFTLPDLTEPAKPLHRPDDVNLADCGDLLVRNHNVDRENVPAETEREADDDGTANPDSQPDEESWNADEFLPPEEPAPPLPKGSSSNPGHESLDRLLAPVVVRLIFQLGKTLSTPEIWKEVPPPKPSPRRLNRVGDFLGRGAGKKSLRLWPGAGVFAPCRENVVICLHRLTEEEIKDLAHSLGYPTRPAFEAAIAALPSAKVGTTA